MNGTLRSYGCRLRGSDHETIYNSTSRGRAKRQYLLDLDMEVSFTEILARCLGPAVTTERIRRVGTIRGVPFAQAGMVVEVCGHRGRIVGANSSGNFDVLFDAGPSAGLTLNCHPHWEIVYRRDDGEILADFRSASSVPSVVE